MTEVLYMKGVEENYIKEFDASVVGAGEDYVLLDRTAFYAEGGGQPTDTGYLEWEGGKSKVKKVTKMKGLIQHHVDRMPEKEEVHGVLDWDRRYAHMRMHTSQHLVSGVVFDLYKARTVGNQLHAEYARIDFHPASFTDDDLRSIEEACNDLISKALPIEIYEEERSVLEEKMGEQRYILDLIPKSIRNLRVVQIGDIDICPCGGTHVRNLSELGKLHIIKRRSKGKDTERLVHELL